MVDEVIVQQEIESLFESKYATFAASGNARAIPDVRDGLKPVHRRVLHATKQNAPSSRPTVKCSAIVGDILGRFHPHGDASVYDALTRMTKDYVNTVPLIFGQGNMGAIDGSRAAAMRYTEAKLQPLADWLVMDGINDGAVPMVPNYDGRYMEPTLLPVKVPMLLLNGVPGGSIGVGYASEIPPHNLKELVEATKVVLNAMLEGVEPELADIMQVMPGPDFPTGGIIGNRVDIANAYATGSGVFRVRGRAHVENEAVGRVGARIVITEIPFGVTTEGVFTDVMEAAFGKRDPKTRVRSEPTIPEIKAAREETTKNRRTKEVEVRIVVDLKTGENPDVVLEKLYRNTRLQTSFGTNMTVLNEDGLPTVVNLIGAITAWINFRVACIRREANTRMQKIGSEIHVIKGLVTAATYISEVVAIIRNAENDEVATGELMAQIGVSSKQAAAILSMRLGRLTRMGVHDYSEQLAKLEAAHEAELSLVTDQDVVIGKIVTELDEAVKRVGRDRRTTIMDMSKTLDVRDIIAEEDCLVSVSERGYIRRLPIDEFRITKRNTKGAMGAKVQEGDALKSVISAGSHDRIFAITDSGYVVRLEAHEIPVTRGNGRHAANLGFDDSEVVRGVLVTPFPVPDSDEAVFATRTGGVKRVKLGALDSNQTKRLVFFPNTGTANVGEVAGAVRLSEGSCGDILLAATNGYAIRIRPDDVRMTQRVSGTMKGIELAYGAEVASIQHIEQEDQLILTVMSDGVGKRTACDQFPAQNRGGTGRILAKPKTGARLVEALVVTEKTTVLIATKHGHTVRTRVDDIREMKRQAMGVKLIDLSDGDEVISAAILPEVEEATAVAA